MKTFFWRLLLITYSVITSIVLLIAIVYPFSPNREFSFISPYFLYPATIIICASQGQILNYLIQKAD